ncbi:hypothetical protein C0995_011154 [Termitomyces sp. Mi166|nr:hypothetical protein C0995_011154 [Termitomyces sp. Mi166\
MTVQQKLGHSGASSDNYDKIHYLDADNGKQSFQPGTDMLFCPTCANLLVISSETGYNKWACNTCAYEFPITKQVGIAWLFGNPIHSENRVYFQMTSRTKLKRKEIDDVLGGDEMWAHADKTMVYRYVPVLSAFSP